MFKKILSLGLGLALLAGSAYAANFADVSDAAGVADDGLGKGVAFADVNNDGLVDLYVSNKGGANKLFLNNGNGRFEDITDTAGAGVDYPGFAMGSVFGDYNNDGNADLYIATGGRHEIEANRLFKGNGDGTFTDVTAEAGVGLKAFTYAASFADYDNDGNLDIYCANYGVGAKNVLYRNNGDGTFSDVGREAGVADGNWGLGASFADIDSDGDQDLFVSNYVGKNNLYLNNGNGTFTEATAQIAGAHEGWGKGPTFGDIDNDGDLDLYEGDCKLANQLYVNDGAGSFKNVADAQPVLQCSTVRTKGTAFADVDNDGDLDLYVVNWGAPNKLYLNQQNDGNYLKVKVAGKGSGYGAKVSVSQNGKALAVREIKSADGFCAQSPNVAHFGLQAGSYDVTVVFADGSSKSVKADTGKIITISQ